MNSVMRKSFCFIITMLIRSSQQRATDLEKTDLVDYSGTDSLQVFPDHVDLWKNISYIKEPIGSPGLPKDNRKKNCPPCRCGVSMKSLGIAGGNSTSVVKYPWMAFIWTKIQGKTYSCGGSLINNKYIMTAAHCFFEKNGRQVKRDQVTVTLFYYNENVNADFSVMKLIVHEKYNPRTVDNDIALLRLKHKGLDIGPNSIYRSVCLPHAGNDFVNYNGIATGWGVTKENGEVSDVLREVSIPIISNRECERFDIGLITDNMMCAEFEAGGRDTCKGDSGGPLHIEDDSTYYVVGIVSWGKGCARPRSPGVYTRVNKYLDWLAVNTEDACSCSEQ